MTIQTVVHEVFRGIMARERIADVVRDELANAPAAEAAAAQAATEAIDTEPRIMALQTAETQGDKALSLKSAYYAPAANGTTDDRAALQQMLDDGAGGTVTIAKGTYAIYGQLVPSASTEIIIQPGTVIEQKRSICRCSMCWMPMMW